jgi:hypothetical protein
LMLLHRGTSDELLLVDGLKRAESIRIRGIRQSVAMALNHGGNQLAVISRTTSESDGEFPLNCYRWPAPGVQTMVDRSATSYWPELLRYAQKEPRPFMEPIPYLLPAEAHSLPFTATRIAFTADGSGLLTNARGGEIRWWDFREGERLVWNWPLEQLVSLTTSPTGSMAAAGDITGRVILWDLEG